MQPRQTPAQSSSVTLMQSVASGTPEIRAAAAASVRCADHPGAMPVETAYIGWRGDSRVAISCPACPWGELADYAIPVPYLSA